MARTITLRLRQPQNILGIESKAESHQSNSNSSNMKKQVACVIGTLVSSPVAYLDEREPKRILQDPSTASASASASAYKVDRMEKFERKEGNLASGIQERVKLGPKITETVKGKLSLGAKIIRAGGVEKIFKQNFSNREGEKLLKASQCYLSTTAGPIAGLLFISTDKVAFFSDRSIKLSSPIGEFIRLRYKAVIPVSKDKESQ
ncbi:putative GEM-like protein 8 [Camellia sinensis]|uniref:putative GEM-like protein 8 n=1 Tax=Camellia sinensis TaxID=4442 RepID=UPI001035B674|nr:putative GEM-like protein 8 [Camellia sinensis]XP_028108656.1 putative GEM-like protein 8 [Camellia sinensis]